MFLTASGADVIIHKMWSQVSKNVNWWTVWKDGFEKCKVMLRKLGVSFVAAKSEPIDLI